MHDCTDTLAVLVVEAVAAYYGRDRKALEESSPATVAAFAVYCSSFATSFTEACGIDE